VVFFQVYFSAIFLLLLAIIFILFVLSDHYCVLFVASDHYNDFNHWHVVSAGH